MAGIWQKARFAHFSGRRSVAALVVASGCFVSTAALAQLFGGQSEFHREQWEIDQDPWRALPDPSGHLVEHICSTGEGYIRVKDMNDYAFMTDPLTGKQKSRLRPRQVVKVYADTNAVAHGNCNVDFVDGDVRGLGWVPLSMFEPGYFKQRAKPQGTNSADN